MDKGVETGPIAIYFGLAYAQAMPHLPKLQSHTHGRQSCYKRVTTNTYNMTIKAICFPLNKINEESLSTVGKRKKKRYKRQVVSEIEIILINNEIKRKMLVYNVQLCYRTKAKEGTTPSTWITSSTAEIPHFERTGLNGLCLNKSFIFNRG